MSSLSPGAIEHRPTEQHGRLKLAAGSLLISLFVLGLKYAAWRVSHSIALKSDALETLINVAAAAGGLWAIYIAGKPADRNHTYGHYKAEYLSAIAEAALVLFTAVTIADEAIIGWLHPEVIHAPWLGIALNGAATLVNLVWGLTLLANGRRQKSPALVAGAHHVLSDVWTGVGLAIGVSLVPLTGFLRLDALLAGAVALNVLRVGWLMLKESVDGLMDRAPQTEVIEQLETVIRENGAGAIEAHDIRIRAVGAVSFIEFHLVVPANMTVGQAHVICDRLEEGIRRVLGRSLINIHVEPENKVLHRGVAIDGYAHAAKHTDLIKSAD